MNSLTAPSDTPSRLPTALLTPRRLFAIGLTATALCATALGGADQASANRPSAGHKTVAHWTAVQKPHATAAHRHTAGACAAKNATPAQVDTEELAQATLCLLNAERGRYQLRPLAANNSLSRAATRHAGDMETRHYFSHVSLDGSNFVQRIKRTGYLRGVSSWFVGENLAWGAGDHRSTAQGIVEAWMQSPPHRANILNGRFREIGIGIVLGAPRQVRGNPPAATYATSFGTRG